AKGVPGVVQRAGILPPQSSMNAVEPEVIAAVTAGSSLSEKYGEALDRESAYEVLTGEYEKAEQEKAETEAAKKAEEERKAAEKQAEAERKQKEKEQREKDKAEAAKKKGSRKKTSALGKVTGSMASTIGRKLGEALIRGLLGIRKK
ncbi:MAG: DUF853 family protein, partial [Clostridia bacterium]|nr:DUF853 family protein [Clostridia bacterium]